MQGKKLLPGQQNIARRRFRPGSPDRRRRDRALDPAEKVAKALALEFALERSALGIAIRVALVDGLVAGSFMTKAVGENVDQRVLEPA